MSSMRNVVNRRVHRERAQPLERTKLGLLEKHKVRPPLPPLTHLSAQNSLRARDFNKKKKQLKSLRQKAAERNEDEFYFSMLTRQGPGNRIKDGKKWSGTVNGDRGNKVLDMDTVRLLKTQDIGFLRTNRTVAAKEVAKLEERVIGMGGSPDGVEQDEDDEEDDEDDFGGSGSAKKTRTKPKKIVFFDGEPQRDETLTVEAAVEDDAEEEDGGEADGEPKPEALRAEQRQRLLVKLQRRLQSARKKLRALATAENQLELQRAKMAKTATVGGVTKAGKKFKVRERKR